MNIFLAWGSLIKVAVYLGIFPKVHSTNEDVLELVGIPGPLLTRPITPIYF